MTRTYEISTTKIPRGVVVQCQDDDGLAVVQRPDGDTPPGYIGIINLQHSKYNTGLYGITVDGRLSQNPGWPLQSVDSAMEHAPNIEITSLSPDNSVLYDGVVTVDGVTSFNAVSDGIVVQGAVRVLINNCTSSGCSRLGIGIADAGCIGTISNCSTEHLHYEPDARVSYPLASNVTYENITLTGARVCNLLLSEPDVYFEGTNIAIASLMYLEDGCNPVDVTSVGTRMLMTNCQADATTIYQPRDLVMDNMDTGPVGVYFQTLSRQWVGGLVTIQNRTFDVDEVWTTYGLGQIDIVNCVGDFVIDSRDASGPFDPGYTTPMVVTRGGYTFNLTAPDVYTIDAVGNIDPIPPVAPSTMEAVAIAAGLDHIWSFDNAGTPTADSGGVAGATLTVSGTVTNYAPTVTGSLGYYDQATQTSSANRLRHTGGAADVARTADCWWEGVIQTPDPLNAGAAQAIVQLGTYTDPASFMTLRFDTALGCFRLYSLPGGNLGTQIPTLTDTYTSVPTYVAVQWNSAAGTFTIYYNNGSGEGSVTTASTTAGSAGFANVYFGGDGSYQFSSACKYHYAAFHRGTISSTHRNNIYAAMGF